MSGEADGKAWERFARVGMSRGNIVIRKNKNIEGQEMLRSFH